MSRLLVASLMLAGTAVGLASATAQEIDVDALPVRKAIADRMTPDELHAYKLKLAQAIKEQQIRRARPPLDGPLTPADTCTAATYEIGSLPFNSSDTTTGMIDDYDLPSDTTDPTCTASTNCTGGGIGCGPRGCIYAGTGTAPDRAYRIRVDAPCDLSIAGTPTAAPPDEWDLALVVYQTQCSSSLSDCVCVDDSNFPGETESVLLNAVPGLDYFIVIDGYFTSGIPNLGPFDLSVNGSGCVLVPAELLDFEIS